MEFHWNTIRILLLILSKFTACFPELFWLNATHFLAERIGILMELLWYFDGIFVVFSRIWVVFWWNFSGILMEFQSKKAMRKVLLAEFNRYFCGIFHVFFHLAIPQKSMDKSPALSELNWYFDGNFTQLALLIKTLAEKSQTT